MSSDSDGAAEEGSADEPEPNVVVSLLQTVTPNFIRRSFAIKFGLVLMIMAVSIGLIGFVATERITAETKENVREEYRSVARQEADIIEEWLESNKLSARFVSTSSDWTSGTTTDLTRRLNGQQNRLGADVFQIHLVKLDRGRATVVASTSNAVEPGTELDAGPRSWFSERILTIQGLGIQDVFVQDTYAVGSKRVVGFVTPTGGNRYILMEVSVSGIKSSLQGQERAQGGFTQVVNAKTNVVVIDENGTDTLDKYASSQAALEPVRLATQLRNETGKSAGVISKMEPHPAVINEVYTVGYSPVEGINWVVLTHAPRSSVFGFVQTVSNFGLIATAFAVLLIGVTGSVLGYSTSNAIDRLTEKTDKMREGDLDVDFATSRIDNIGRLYDGFAEMRDALKQQIEEAERARKEAEVSRAEAEEMSNYLQEKAEEYSAIMQQCSAGDLTQRMEQDGENEAMDQIASEFNDMIEELEKTTGQLKSYVDEVEEAGAEVERSATTVREASEQVADSVQKISDDAHDQRERLQSISESMDAIASDLEDVADRAEADIDEPLSRIQEIANEVSEIADLSREMMDETENVAGAAEEQAAELNEVSERAHDLQRYAQPLRDILQRFETEAEHEFVFSVGPTGGTAPGSDDGDD